jgi:hypothetical protein
LFRKAHNNGYVTLIENVFRKKIPKKLFKKALYAGVKAKIFFN